MEIKQLRYFMTIVENNFNLSRAAEILYVSQPTLSMMINEFEKREEIKLFKREKGRIKGLTYLGENYYKDASQVLKNYNEMFINLHDSSKGVKGTVNIGIPPFILSVVFSTVMPRLILENSDIKFNIIETGAYNLRNELLLGNVDIAVLLSPTGLAENLIETYAIQESELAVYVSKCHKLAKRKQVTWQDLDSEKLAIFDPTFMINHLLLEAFERHQVHPNIILTSGSWDFMLNSTKINHEIMTILPTPINTTYHGDDVVCIPMEEPIKWRVVLSRLRKENYSQVEAYIMDSLIQSFSENNKIERNQN